MPPNQIPVSEADKRILETIRTEFFPALNKIKDLLTRIQSTRLVFFLYSPGLSKLEQEYFEISQALFVIDRKLTTPDILFEGLSNIDEGAAAYFRFNEAIKKGLAEATGYIEIVDRTLDRKKQTLQNNRTLLLA